MPITLKQYSDHQNAGDVASAIVVSHIVGESLNVVGLEWRSGPNLLAIGSILEWADEQSLVWGSGFIREGSRLPAAPKAILAVRGELTRAELNSQGIACDPVLGRRRCLHPRHLSARPCPMVRGTGPPLCRSRYPVCRKGARRGAARHQSAFALCHLHQRACRMRKDHQFLPAWTDLRACLWHSSCLGTAVGPRRRQRIQISRLLHVSRRARK